MSLCPLLLSSKYQIIMHHQKYKNFSISCLSSSPPTHKLSIQIPFLPTYLSYQQYTSLPFFGFADNGS